MSGNRCIPSSVLKGGEVIFSGGCSVSCIRGWAAPEPLVDLLSSLSLASNSLNVIRKARGLLCACDDLYLRHSHTPPAVTSTKTTTEINTTIVITKGIKILFLSELSPAVCSLFPVEISDILVCLSGLEKLAEVTFMCTVSEGTGALLVMVPSLGVAVECLYDNDIKDEDGAKTDRYILDIEMLSVVLTAVSDGKQIDGQGSSNLHFLLMAASLLQYSRMY